MTTIRGIVFAALVCGSCSSNIITIPSPVPPAPAPVVVVPPPAPTPTPTPTPSVYTCAERDAEIAAFLAGPHVPLPVVTRLPSGERVYINDNYPTPGSLIHYDGPSCTE